MSKADDAIAQVPGQLWSLKIVGRDNFIELNRRYPGEHKIEFQDSHYVYDCWDHTYQVTTQVYIESQMPDGTGMKLYAISIWDVDSEGLITGAQEFWADCSEPPAWRKDLVEHF